MRTYVVTTGAVFALLVVAHIWRTIEEGATLIEARDGLLLACVCLSACSGGAGIRQQEGSTWKLAWADEFNEAGRPDPMRGGEALLHEEDRSGARIRSHLDSVDV